MTEHGPPPGHDAGAPERAAGGAITAYLAAHGRDPHPYALARAVAEAVGATGCAITVGGVRSQWGFGPGPWREHEIAYGGEVHGLLALTPGWVAPLAEIAALLGPPIAAVRLTVETDRRRRDGDAAARAMADERWRAAAEMEQERRRLERDLHDGAQHHLVALRLSLALAEHAILTADGAARVADLVAQLEAAERSLVETASGILPRALVSGGLAAALRDELGRYDTVTLDTAALPVRYATPIESAVYFVVLEAVNNARKHAPGARVTVTLRAAPRGLEFVVRDDGPGFAMSGTSSGLLNLTARAASVGGIVEVRSAPRAGTTVSGHVPG